MIKSENEGSLRQEAMLSLLITTCLQDVMALTKYQEGSMRELWCIAFPLMLSSFSVMSMLFVDRLLLAHYSSAALNAVVNAMTLGYACICGWMVMGSITEVFVAQYNGAGQKQKLGEPVWQIIWLSLTSIFFFIPLTLWGGEWIYGSGPENSMEREYFSWMMSFGPSYPIYTALCGFFIGQGKMRLVTILALLTNGINAGLDLTLIFGIEGIVPAMGIEGAAIATSCSSLFQMLILAAVFLNQSNRKLFGTGNYYLQSQAFWQCLKVGIPGAVFVVVEVLGWAVFYAMMTNVGERYITVVGICQSVAILFYFFCEGVSKAVSTVAGNLIGAKQSALMSQVIKSGVKLHMLFFFCILVCFVTFADLLIAQFLPLAHQDVIESLREAIMTSLIGITFYLLFEGIRMLFSGVLTAAGDTLFLLIAGSLSVWLFLVLPVYLVVVKHEAPVEVATFICVFYSLSACLIFLARFWQGKWKQISITQA